MQPISTSPSTPRSSPLKAARLGVLVSGQGRGTNFNAILGAIGRDELHAKVALLIASRESHGAVAFAREANIRTLILPPDEFESDQLRDARISDEFYAAGVSIVVLAGYLRRVSSVLLEAFPGRILNVHPSLLPSFGGQGMFGARVHKAVLEHGCRVSGCTVHLLDDRYDSGPIVAQSCVPVEDDDTPESLAARVQNAEHRLYPQCIEWLAQGKLRLEGRRVRRL